MGKPKKTVPVIFKKIGLPEDLVARIELELFSDLEGKIPFGAQQQFFENLVRKHYAEKDAARATVSATQTTAIEHFQLSDEAYNGNY